MVIKLRLLLREKHQHFLHIHTQLRSTKFKNNPLFRPFVQPHLHPLEINMTETGLSPDPYTSPVPEIVLDEDARAILIEAARRMGRSPNYVVILAVSAFLGHSSASAAYATAPRKPVTRSAEAHPVGDNLLSPPPPPRPVKTKVLVNGPHAFEIRGCEFHWSSPNQLKSATLQLQHVERGTMFDLTVPVGWQWDKITSICSALIHSTITDPSQLIGCQLDFICSNGKPIRLPK